MCYSPIRPKKKLGQHFLRDDDLAQRIVDLISVSGLQHNIIEIGPGTGSLTKALIKKGVTNLYLIELDNTLVMSLRSAYPMLKDNILNEDFLKVAIDQLFFNQSITVIGNLPYNISSQIFFKILSHRQQIQEMVCMIQKEVAQRIIAQPRSKMYGIPSVLLQTFYTIDYCFTVEPHLFNPPPKVYSAVIRMKRNTTKQLNCNELLFFNVVKTGFQQRRKKLKNSLHSLLSRLTSSLNCPLLNQRAEELTIADFVTLTQLIDELNTTHHRLPSLL